MASQPVAGGTTGQSASTDLTETADRYLGAGDGAVLFDAGPATTALWSLIGNETTTQALVASVYWAAFAYSSAFTRMLDAAGIRLPVLAGVGSSPARAVQEAGRRQTMIVPHAGSWQRFDLMVLDAEYRSSTPWSERVKVDRNQLLEGWARLVAETHGHPVDKPHVGGQSNWMEHIPIDNLGEVAAEASAAAEFAIMVTRLPPLVQTATCPSPPWAVEDDASNRLATAGVFATNGEGREGVTTANHAIPDSITRVLVNGNPGTVGKRHPVSDSCFIETGRLPSVSSPGLVPLRGVSPRQGEDVDFEGSASGRVTTRVQAWDAGIPFVVQPWIQLSVRTKPVTNLGDSGAALLDRSGHVIGFSFYRTGFGSEIEFSAWMWAELVFMAHGLR